MSAFLRDLPLVVFLVFFVAFPLGAAALCLVAAFRARRQVAALKTTPVSSIGMADDGYRKVAGTGEAIGGQMLSSPLTHSACLWYLARVEHWARPTRDGQGSWSTVQEQQSSALFLLRDATGVCAVAPWGAEVTPSDKSQWYGSTLAPTDRNPPRLGPTDSSQPMWEGNERYRYYEERIYADSNLTIAGQFSHGRFICSPSDFGDDQDDDEKALPEDEPGGTTDGSYPALEDKLETLARDTTRARIGKSSEKPFIITTQLEAAHVAVSEMGSQAAMGLAAGLIGLATLMLYARFG